MALGEVGGVQPVPVIGAVAQVERHDRAVQQADDPAQRAHPGERAGAAPAHRFRPGEAAQQVGTAAAISVGGGNRRRCLVQHPGLALARSWPRRRRACAGSRSAPARARWRAARVRWCGSPRPAGATARRQRDAARAVEGAWPSCGDSAPSASATKRARSSAARACMRAGISSLNSSRKKLRHGQSFSAGSMSVWEKSLPLNSSGSPLGSWQAHRQSSRHSSIARDGGPARNRRVPRGSGRRVRR